MTEHVRIGLEVLADNPGLLPADGRLGLLQNQASVDDRMRLACDVLAEVFPGRLQRLFSPQHGFWSEQQAKYVIESMASHYAGKVRHAEFWLGQLINTFVEVQGAGLDDVTLNAARAKHTEAHANWEWWTASNGSAFHNLDQAKDSLAKSAAASQEGVKILRDAVVAKRKAAATPAPTAAAPAPAK